METLKELSTFEDNAFLKSFPATQKPTSSGKADKFNAAHFSTGQASASFTSTVMEPMASVEAAVLDDFEILYPYIKKKGYVRLVTNFGNINL